MLHSLPGSTNQPPDFPPETMLTQQNRSRRIHPLCTLHPAHRTPPDLVCHPGKPGSINHPRQWHYRHLLRLHGRSVTRPAETAGMLLVTVPGSPFRCQLLHVRCTLLSAGIARGFRLRSFEQFVVACPDDSIVFCSRRGHLQHLFSTFAAGAGNNRSRI